MKRVLSLLMVLAMLCGMVMTAAPMAFAAEATWVKVTEAPTDWSGTYLIVYETETDAKVFNASSSSIDKAQNYVIANVTDNKIIGDYSANAITVSKNSTDKYNIQSVANSLYIGNASSTAVSTTSEITTTNETNFSYSFIYENNSVSIVNSRDSRYLCFSIATSGGDRYRHYAAFDATTYVPVQMYKLQESGTVDPEPSEETTTATPAGEVPPISEVAADTAYLFGIIQVNNAHTVYITGEVSNRYLATTDDVTQAAQVYVEVVEGGYKFYIMVDGAKSYIDVYQNADNKTAVQFSTEGNVFTYNPECGNWTTEHEGVTHYLGAYNNFDTISASRATYINSENAGVSQFPAGFFSGDTQNPVKPEPQLPPVTTVSEDMFYQFGVIQVTNGTTLYLTGAVDGRYLVTTEDINAAANVYVEAVEGGYMFYILVEGAKSYIDIYNNEENKVSVQFAAEGNVFSFNAECSNWVTDHDDTAYYLGTYNNFTTVSASKATYINASNSGITQFPAGFFGGEYIPGTAGNPIVLNPDAENTLLAGTNHYVAYNVDGMILTVNGATSVVYNGTTYEPVDGVITIEGLTTGRGMPASFVITAEAGTASFSFPLGTWQNPDTLVLGDVSVTANNVGYELHWIAPSDGALFITMTCDDFVFSVGNRDMVYSSDGLKIDGVPVAAGDEVIVIVSPQNSPEAEITFNAKFIENPFTDITGHDSFKPAVLYLFDRGIISGKTHTTFEPASNITRGQFVMMLWRAAGKPATSITESPFVDVQGNDSFKTAVLWALEMGITKGQTATEFGLNEPCTRTHMITFLYRYAGEPTVSDDVVNPFADVQKDRFYNAIMWGYSNGILSGRNDPETNELIFDGASTTLRRHVAKILFQYLIRFSEGE